MVKPVALNPNASIDRHEPYVKPRIKNDRPAYVVINDGFYDQKDRFRQAGSHFYYDGEPNQNLVPLNKLANDKMNAFIEKLNTLSAAVHAKAKKQFTPQATKEWVEGEDFDLPMVEHVFGMPKADDGKDDIR